VDDSQKKNHSAALLRKKRQLDIRLAILIPIIDMVELAVTRGYYMLESALDITDELKLSIEKLSTDMENGAEKTDSIVKQIAEILEQSDELVPLLQLALTASGVSFSNRLDAGVSPNRLVQASSFITRANYSFSMAYSQKEQGNFHLIEVLVGPVFVVKTYSLFEGSARKQSNVDWTWKEEYTKTRVSLYRYPGSSADEPFDYRFAIEQDLNDGRFHDESVGKRRKLKVSEIARMFYTSSGKILNIEESTMPVLILKIKHHDSKSTPGKSTSTPTVHHETEWLL
jgi:RanGTP-binding protein